MLRSVLPDPRSRRRSPGPLVVVGLLLAVLMGCSEDPEPVGVVRPGAPEGFEAVTISDDLESEPTVEWKDQMAADELETEVVAEGDGPVLAEGDQVVLNYYIGNGFTQSPTYSSYDDEPSGQLLTLSADFAPIFRAALEDQRIGSRVAVVGSAANAFGETGNPELGIGTNDTVLLVVDLSSDVREKAEGEKTPAPGWVPGLVQDQGVPARFGFKNTPEPTEELRVARLITGDGPKVEKGDLLVANYLGQTYGSDQPFDESFTKEEPLARGIGTGDLIKAWDRALVGVPVGSRVILAVPPKLGYGPNGNPEAGIGGTDTLFFLIDVLGAG